MARTTAFRVQAILGDNYDGTTDCGTFITTANLIVNRLAALDTDSILDTDTLAEIEAWLAAHAYAHHDQLMSSKSTGRGAASFQGQYGMGFQGTKYGQMALSLDFTGNLATLGKKQPKMSWLGKTDSEKLDYEDRN